MPAPPRPVTTEASVPHSAAISVLAAVVPPTLRSPSTTRSVPASASSSAIAIPARNAASASSAVSASSTSIRPEPRRTRCRVTSSGSSAGSQSTARSTTRSCAAVLRASTAAGLAPSSAARTRSRVLAGRPGRDAQLRHAVIAREQQHPRPLDRPHRHLLLRGGQPFAQLVEAAERPRRHGQPRPPLLGVTAHTAVGALDQVGEVIEVQGAHWAQITVNSPLTRHAGGNGLAAKRTSHTRGVSARSTGARRPSHDDRSHAAGRPARPGAGTGATSRTAAIPGCVRPPAAGRPRSSPQRTGAGRRPPPGAAGPPGQRRRQSVAGRQRPAHHRETAPHTPPAARAPPAATAASAPPAR